MRAQIKASGDDFTLDDDDEAGLLWEDSGIWGILDKIAAMEAALFVSASRGCGRVRSVCARVHVAGDVLMMMTVVAPTAHSRSK